MTDKPQAIPWPSTDEPAEESGSVVDELFARIRAGRPDDEPAELGDGDDPAGAVPDEIEADAATAATAATDAAEDNDGAVDGGDGGEPRLSDGDEALIQKRESAVVDLEVALARKLKRALQDEQNDMLDRLRSLRGEPSAARLLPDVDEQVSRYAGAIKPLLTKAASAGAALAAEVLGGRAPAGGGASALKELADEASRSIVGPLRRLLEQAIDAHAGEEQTVLVESLGSAYREWKTQRIERIAGDALAAAFARGTWHAMPDGASMRWIVEDLDGPCPDCDDDALAGTLPKGEAFPTGQLHPPAHSGCRCLLIPVLT